jgi:membrane-bound lytic murein transglycosylase D
MYTQSSSAFSASLSEAMPYLLVVLDQIERRKLPGEFAFLPYIESTYTPLASSGDHAAGIWQLMPDTAREAGLRITADYDGRLDIYSSTTAALSLLERYQEKFGDWRIADMAFNAGPYGLMQLVSDTRDDRSAAELSKLRVHAGTHEHLAKLLAVACVISDPQHYKVELPDPDDDDLLAFIELPAPLDLELAARLAGVDGARLHHWNPGFLHGRMPANGPFHLLVPATRRVALEQTLGKLPQYAWRDWHAVTLKQNETIDLFASQSDLDASALATINNVAADAPLPPGTHLLLPGRATLDSAVVEVMPIAPAVVSAAGVMSVRAGDTLWSIAHQHGVHVDDLLRWNGLSAKATLHLGQRLHLSEPDEAPGGHKTAAAPAAN